MRTRTIEASSGRILLREWGAATRETVLFWHGSGDDGRRAAPLAARLEALVVAPDAPGHGGSAPLHQEEYRPSRLAALAVEILDALDVDRVVAVGFSWGASIVCRLAATVPDRVRAVVLVEGGHVDFADLPGFDGDATLEERVKEHGLGGALAHGLVLEPNVDTYPSLARSGVPVVLVTSLPPDAADSLGLDPLARFRRAVPQLEVAVVAGAGHDLVADDPAAVAAAAARFLGSGWERASSGRA